MYERGQINQRTVEPARQKERAVEPARQKERAVEPARQKKRGGVAIAIPLFYGSKVFGSRFRASFARMLSNLFAKIISVMSFAVILWNIKS